MHDFEWLEFLSYGKKNTLSAKDLSEQILWNNDKKASKQASKKERKEGKQD